MTKKKSKTAKKKTTTKKSMTKKAATKKAATKKGATKKAATKKAASKKASPKKATTKKATAKKATVKVATKKAKTPVATTAKATAGMGLASLTSIRVGEPVPDFKLPATGGAEIALAGLKGKNVVLYFYPKDSTPGCTLQGQEFTQLHNEFKNSNTEVYGISRDSLQSHENFKSTQGYTIDLLSDKDESVCNIFGVMKDKNMYGKQVRGVERSTFVIGKDGQLMKEWRGVQVAGHAAEVLNFIKSNNE